MKFKLVYLILCSFWFWIACGQNSNSEIVKPTPQSKTTEMSEEEWKEKLSPEQYYVLREKGTEKPFSGQFVFTKEEGVYRCAGCGAELFTDDMKFESFCGWPSFDREVEGGKIKQTDDYSHGMHRIEITCANCGGHLGHIFDDGPTDTGKRYCVNSAALTFEPAENKSSMPMQTMDTLTIGGGCFWCIEAIFEELHGVEKVVSGYSGGKNSNPTYAEVSAGTSGHAEVVQITFDAKQISLEELLEVFFSMHDPTTLNRQGADVGTQYRSVIFYRDSEQKKTAENIIQTLNSNKAFKNPIVTQIEAFQAFYPAEDYHQEYYELNKELPYCKLVITPKMDKLHKIFADKIKK